MTQNQLKIIRLRRDLGISQQELGNQLGVSPQTISAWETGFRNPPKSIMILIEKIFK